MFYTYILRSLLNGRHSFGSCADVELRLKSHNAGKVRSTKAYLPWKTIYVESFASRSEAYQREMFFKSFEGRHWLKQQNIL